jgi:hypothetical protein
MNDLMLFLGALVLIFMLWVYSGGPNNPISFSGPFITPVTDVNDTQVGYDDPDAYSWTGPRWGSANYSNTKPDEAIDAAYSPYSGKVDIVRGTPESKNAATEYFIIRSTNPNTITLDDWQLVSAKTGEQVRLGSKRVVRLSKGERIVVVSGTSGKGDIVGIYDNDTKLYLGERSDIWSDSSDTVTLIDASGKVVDQYTY